MAIYSLFNSCYKRFISKIILDAPIQAKKTKFNEHQKIKQAISKNLHKSMEKQIRNIAGNDKIQLSQAQKAVAQHNQSSS